MAKEQTFEDLDKMLDEQAYQEIPVKSLTKFELDSLKASGVDVSGTTVRVMTKPPKTFKQEVKEETVIQPEPRVTTEQLESPSSVKPKPSAEKITVDEKVVEQSKIKTDPIDEQEYLRCTLGMKPFVRMYSFMGGNVSVTFHTRTSQRNYMLASILRRIRTEYGMINQDIINTVFLGFQLRLSISSVRVAEKSIEFSEPDSSDYEKLQVDVQALLDSVSPTVYRNIAEKFIEFEQLVDALDARISDENFYNQTGA